MLGRVETLGIKPFMKTRGILPPVQMDLLQALQTAPFCTGQRDWEAHCRGSQTVQDFFIFLLR